MSVDEIKKSLAGLSSTEQDEVMAYLFHLRRRANASYEAHVSAVLDDKNPEHWLTPEEFEKRRDAQ